MSEHESFKESEHTALNPEMIQGLFSDQYESEYSEDFRERLRTAPVFDTAARMQRILSEQVIPSKDVHSEWAAMRSSLRALDAQALDQHLINQTSSLRGDGIVHPNMELDLVKQVSFVSVRSEQALDEKTLPEYYAADETTGLFAGFTIRFIDNQDGTLTPQLAYQLTVNSIETPNATTNLYATGIVGQTALYFEQDEKLDHAALLLERLYEVSADQGATVNLINMSLTRTESYDASLIRHVAYHSEKLVSAVEPGKSEIVEDALIELLSHHIGIRPALTIKTATYTMSSEDAGGEILFYPEDIQPIEIKAICVDTVFLNRRIVKDGVVVARPGRVLHFVFHANGQNIYVPADRVETYSKL